ncbi:MAG: NfeD family protein [Clostridiales Family XIII bacterium]|jgi:membrane protein implicated in regulation of membrane protease activity|nr:NfeD family protein [Clostridiales Family XIII bacterium]
MFENMAVVWIVVAVLFAVIEGFTMGFVTVWFSVGGIAAAISALFGASLSIQIVIFFAVSIILLIFTRPILVKHLKLGKEKTNVDAIAGKIGVVMEEIKPYETGLVKVNGVPWTAEAKEQEETIAANSRVKILSVEGVRLIVEKAE